MDWRGRGRRLGQHRLHDRLRALLGDVVVRSVCHDEATVRRGADDSQVAVAPGAVDIRLLPPRFPAVMTTMGSARPSSLAGRISASSSNVRTMRAMAVSWALVGCSRWGTVDGRSRPLPGRSASSWDRRGRGADLLRVEVRVQERSSRRTSARRRSGRAPSPRPLERLVELADLLPRCQLRRAPCRSTEAGPVVHRRFCSSPRTRA